MKSESVKNNHCGNCGRQPVHLHNPWPFQNLVVAQFNRHGQQKSEQMEELSLDITGQVSFWWYLIYVAGVGGSNDISPLQQTKSVQKRRTFTIAGL